MARLEVVLMCRPLTIVAVFIITFITFAVPQSPRAQEAEPTFHIGPVFGWSFPITDFFDVADPSWSFGATADRKVRENFAVGASVVSHHFEPVEELWNAFGRWESIDVDLDLLQITVHGKYVIPIDRIQLQTFGGIGLYRSSSKVDGHVLLAGNQTAVPFRESDSDNYFGANAGAGVRIPVGKVVVDVNGVFHVVNDDDNSMFIGSSAGLILVF
jgi:hypothetical protein